MNVKTVSVTELQALLEKKEKISLVDCREEFEWSQGHLPNAQHIPLSEFTESYQKIEDKKNPVIIYCRSGIRSYKIAAFLAEQGYQDVANLEGGFVAWANEHPEKK